MNKALSENLQNIESNESVKSGEISGSESEIKFI